MEIEKCQSCGKPFKVWEHKLAMPGTKEKEPLSCPYSNCGHTIQRKTSGTWETFKLTEEQQREYIRNL
jgi:DNA-directed RNA polymerase subunit RPC12/RpoP